MPKKKAKQEEPKTFQSHASGLQILIWADGEQYPHVVDLTPHEKQVIAGMLIHLHKGVIKMYSGQLVGVCRREDPAPTPK